MQNDVTSTDGGEAQPPSAGQSPPLNTHAGEPGSSVSEAAPRSRSPRSLLAAELLLSAHDHPAQFSLLQSSSMDPNANAPPTNEPGAEPHKSLNTQVVITMR